MAFTPISTTIGPWTVTQEQTLTPTATCPDALKDVSVGNFNFLADWTLAESNPDKTVYKSTTGTGQESPAVLRASIRPVANVYSNCLTKPAKLANTLGGTQINLLLEQTFTVSNSVSGEFGNIPLKFSVTLTVPKHSSVTADLIKKYAVQSIGAMFGSNEVLGDMIAKLFRGDLILNL